MPVPTLISQLSTAAASNSPAGSESAVTNDDYLRVQAAFIAQLRDGTGFTGTLSPATAVRVGGATQGQVGTRAAGGTATIANTGYDDIVIDSSGFSGLSILSGAASSGGVIFGDTGTSSQGRLIYDHVTDTLQLWAGGTLVATLYSGSMVVASAIQANGGIDSLASITIGAAGATLGYGSGSGAITTQAPNKSSTVTLNRANGQITTAATSIAAGAVASFTFNCSSIGTESQVVFAVRSGAATGASYVIDADDIATGSCRVTIRNLTAGALAETLVLSFWIMSMSNA